ncbi:MAG: PAS domain-containing protein [Anaerolineaceae bacterium]|nr:PAS domain-containing protein [Anaerolineaceae bacterium]MCB9101003.1 PAS domain-containing protein [Anaerolineales bacterium]
MQFNSIILPSQVVVPLGVALAHLILTIYVISSYEINRDRVFGLFVAYLSSTILWNINLVVIAMGSVSAGPFLVHLAPYGLVGIAAIYWLFTRTFLQQPWPERWVWAIPITVLLIATGFDSELLALPPAAYTWSNGWLFPANIGFVFCIICAAGFVGLSFLIVLLHQLRTQSPAHRNRIQFLLMATLFLLFGYGLYLSLLEPYWTTGLIITCLGSSLATYVVAVEDLIDLSTAARYTVSRLLTVLLTIAVYISGIYLVQIFLGDLLASTLPAGWVDPVLLVAVVTAVLLTIVYIPIQRVSRVLTNRIVFSQIYDYQKVIQRYTQSISNILYPDELASVALKHIEQTFGVTKAILLMLEAESPESYEFWTIPVSATTQFPAVLSLARTSAIIDRWVQQGKPLAQYTIDISVQFRNVPETDRQALQALNLEWFLPILKQDQLIGVFALGPKASRQRYSAQDLRLLQTLADQTALALENASLVDRLQRHLEEATRMKNLMDSVFDSMQTGVMTIDKQGKITHFNKSAAAILNLSTQNTIGTAYQKMMPTLASTIFSNLMKNVVDRDERYTNYEIISELPERGRVNLTVNMAPLKDAQHQTKGVTVVLEDMTETKRLKAVQDMFRRYVSPAVVDRLPANPSELELGGHRQEITVLFADIRGFTKFSEHMDPEKLVDTLNEYLSMAASSILMYEGTLDKFVGDAVMGIFNAPLDQTDHIMRAVRAAMAMQRAINNYHAKIGQDRMLSFGIGLHVGEAVVGNVGMSDRMDYTAIGDTVNLAKRIQENTPANKILISEPVYQAVNGAVKAIFFKEMKVKNREQPVKTYEIQLDL